MKKIIVILLFCASIVLNGATYYVATDGNDTTGDGSIGTPWATWQKGFSSLVAGDTLYIRGGTYQPIGTSIGTVFSSEWFGCVGLANKNGTAENRIVVMNYPDEIPILDGVNNTAANNGGPGSRFGIIMRRCDYWTLKGLRLTGVVQLEGELGVAGLRFQENSDHNEIIECKVYGMGGSGIALLYDCTDNLIYNCDSYDNYDHLSVPTPGNNSDGIEIANITDTAMTNTIRGCRIWDNSDDGIDLMRNEGIVIIDSCWAFYNGVSADYPATGFKLGQAYLDPVTYQREVTNCIAAYNNSAGFAANVSYQKMKIYNNISANNNDHGFKWYIGARGGASILRNNVSFGNIAYQFSYIYLDTYTFDHNSYDVNFMPSGPVASSADYLSVDTTGMMSARKANGCLPDITGFHLAGTSDLINAGVDVGIAYEGDAPDLGPFEYVVQAPAVSATVVSTTKPYWTSATTAISGGNVIDAGGGTVSSRGVCWNTEGTPTTSDTKTIDGSGTGAYSSTMTGLNKQDTYYVRAYATNEAGTSYGAELTFRTNQLLRSSRKAWRSNGKLYVIQ